MKKLWTKFKLFWREIGNLLTNVLCPFLSIMSAIFELIPGTTKVAAAFKKAEYWAFNACATKQTIDDIINKVDPKVEELAEVIEKAKKK